MVFSCKPFFAAVLGIILSAGVVHAQPPAASGNAQPSTDAAVAVAVAAAAATSDVHPNGKTQTTARSPASVRTVYQEPGPTSGKTLTERSLTAVGEAADKIGDALNTSAQALGTGVQRVTDETALLLQHAKAAIGVPYRWGGSSADKGFDCSGFVRAMVQTVGKLLPRRAVEQAAATQKIDKDELQPGDLVFFNTVRRRAYSHVGIYMGDGQFIHAPARGERVRIDNLSATYWQKHFGGARRIFTGDTSFPGNGLAASAGAPDLIADFAASLGQKSNAAAPADRVAAADVSVAADAQSASDSPVADKATVTASASKFDEARTPEYPSATTTAHPSGKSRAARKRGSGSHRRSTPHKSNR